MVMTMAVDLFLVTGLVLPLVFRGQAIVRHVIMDYCMSGIQSNITLRGAITIESKPLVAAPLIQFRRVSRQQQVTAVMAS